MTNFRAAKVVAAVPANPTPDTLYAVRIGAGFDLYLTNGVGEIIPYKLNQTESGGIAIDQYHVPYRSENGTGAPNTGLLVKSDPEANSLVLRHENGVVRVGEPEHEFDAVNLLYLENFLDAYDVLQSCQFTNNINAPASSGDASWRPGPRYYVWSSLAGNVEGTWPDSVTENDSGIITTIPYVTAIGNIGILHIMYVIPAFDTTDSLSIYVRYEEAGRLSDWTPFSTGGGGGGGSVPDNVLTGTYDSQTNILTIDL